MVSGLFECAWLGWSVLRGLDVALRRHGLDMAYFTKVYGMDEYMEGR